MALFTLTELVYLTMGSKARRATRAKHEVPKLALALRRDSSQCVVNGWLRLYQFVGI